MDIIIGKQYRVSLEAAQAAGHEALDSEASHDGQVVVALSTGSILSRATCADGNDRDFWSAALIPVEVEPCARCAELEAQVANAGHLALIAHIYSVANECAGSDTAPARLFRGIKTAIESAGYVEATDA